MLTFIIVTLLSFLVVLVFSFIVFKLIKNENLLIFILIASSPLQIFYYKLPFIPISVTPARVVILIVSFFTLIKLIQGQKNFFLRPLFYLLILIFFIYSVAFIRADSMFRVQATFDYLTIINFIVTLFVTVSLINNNRTLRFALKYSIITSVLVAIIAYVDLFFKRLGIDIWSQITQYEIQNEYIGALTYQGTTIQRISGTFLDPNAFAYYLFFSIGLMTVSLDKRNNLLDSKIINNILLIFLIITILATLSRSGIVLLFLMLGIIAYKGKEGVFFNKKVILLTLVVSITLFIMYILSSYYLQANWFLLMLDRINYYDNAGLIGEVRAIRYQIGVEAFFSNIFFGVGLDNFGYSFYGLKKEDIITTHVFYLDILASCGLVGFLVVFSLFVYLLYALTEQFQNHHDNLSIAFIAVIIVLLLSQLVYSNLYQIHFAVQIGLIFAYININKKSLKINKKSLNFINYRRGNYKHFTVRGQKLFVKNYYTNPVQNNQGQQRTGTQQ